MAAALPFIAVGAQVAGTLVSMRASRESAQVAEDTSREEARILRRQAAADRDAARLEAAQLEEQARESVAIGQREAAEARRQARIAQSRMLAVAAASGAGASDPTIEALMMRTAGEGAYQAGVALYESESRARTLRRQGYARVVTADKNASILDERAALTIRAGGTRARATRTAGTISALGGAASLAGSLYSGGFGGGGGSASSTYRPSGVSAPF